MAIDYSKISRPRHPAVIHLKVKHAEDMIARMREQFAKLKARRDGVTEV
jgi:hypothetical protein